MADDAIDVAIAVVEAAVTEEQVIAAAVSTSRNPTGKKTDDELELALLQMMDQQIPVREAAVTLGLNIRTAYNLLGRHEESLDALRLATRRMMARSALERIEDWRIASEVGARKKGNHAPARDWLLHAGVIDALDSDTASVKVSINIGTDDRPMRVVSPNDIDIDP